MSTLNDDTRVGELAPSERNRVPGGNRGIGESQYVFWSYRAFCGAGLVYSFSFYIVNYANTYNNLFRRHAYAIRAAVFPARE